MVFHCVNTIFCHVILYFIINCSIFYSLNMSLYIHYIFLIFFLVVSFCPTNFVQKRWLSRCWCFRLPLRYMYNNMYGGHWGDHRRRRFGDFRSQSFCQVTASGSRQGAFMECQTCYNLYGCCSLIFFRLKETFSNKAGWDVCWGSEGEVFVFVFVSF